MRRLLVKATVFVEVEVPDEGPDYCAHFDLVENHCPGTGSVGAAIDAAIRDGDARGVCWACNLGGTNEIVKELP